MSNKRYEYEEVTFEFIWKGADDFYRLVEEKTAHLTSQGWEITGRGHGSGRRAKAHIELRRELPPRYEVVEIRCNELEFPRILAEKINEMNENGKDYKGHGFIFEYPKDSQIAKVVAQVVFKKRKD